MSVASEITRLQNAKANIKSSIEAKGVTVPSETKLDGYSALIDAISSGSSINGQLANKPIQSGTISKGDFVTNGTFEKQDRFSSITDYKLQGQSYISNFANLYDSNDDNYATIASNSGNSAMYVGCKNRLGLNIPATAKLLGVSVTYKISFSNTNSVVKGVYFHKFLTGVVGTNVFNTGNNDYGSITTGYPITATYTFDNDYVGAYDETSCFGIRVTTPYPNQDYLYYVIFNITYESDGEIKQISSLADTIVGIANENGTQGDTIEVYIPNVE